MDYATRWVSLILVNSHLKKTATSTRPWKLKVTQRHRKWRNSIGSNHFLLSLAVLKIAQFLGLSEANHHIRLNHTKTLFKNTYLMSIVTLALFNSLINTFSGSAVTKISNRNCRCVAREKKCRGKTGITQLISVRLSSISNSSSRITNTRVANDVSLSISKSEQAYIIFLLAVHWY